MNLFCFIKNVWWKPFVGCQKSHITICSQLLMMLLVLKRSFIHLYTYNILHCKSSVIYLIHIPNCPSRPSLHFNSICMSKAVESLRGNQPQRHSLSAQCLPGAAEASSAFGESESESLYRSPMGGEESSYSNSVENASTHRGAVTHSWDNKYHGETHDPPANWDQSLDFFPIYRCHQADSFQKANESLSPFFRRAIRMSESVCHVIQDVVYRTTGESGWGETVWGFEMHSLEGRFELKHLGIQSTQHTDDKKLPVWIYYTVFYLP